MKRIRLFSLVLALLMILAMLAGCGSKGDKKPNNDVAPTGNNEQVQNTEGEKNDSNEVDNNEQHQGPYDAFPAGLKAEKIGSIDRDSVNTNSGVALTYRDENGKYGIMSLDGKKDTGAKYTVCEPIGNYFQVMTADETSITDVASLNCVGVVDATGKEIIPLKYASISKISDRYIRVCEVTEQTSNKDEALVYYTDKMFSITASDDDTFFKGKWYVYDMVAGKMLEGVTGTNTYNIYNYGDFIKYVTDAEEQITVNHKGEKLPEDADLFENGYYALVKDNAGAVYDSENNKVFDYALDSYIPSDSEGEYILASMYVNDVRKYVLMDTTGKVVSAEFAERPMVYGELIHSEDKIFNFKGENIIEGTFTNVYLDEQTGHVWFLKNDKNYTMIKSDGTVLYQGAEDDVTSMDPYSYFYIKKKVDDKSMYYSLADKDFTLEGYSFAPWLVQVEKPNYIYDVADFISGQTIISGYERYSYVAVPGSVMYVYALKADGGLDIYTVK